MRTKDDPYWRKAKIAARIILRSRTGKLRPRDRRIAALLSNDPGVEDRLIDQAMACIQAKGLRVFS